MMDIHAWVLGPFQSNAYVAAASLEPGAQAVVIDPGDTHLEPLFEFVAQQSLQVTAVWATHGHLDHILGVDLVRQRYGVPAFVHEQDLPLWHGLPQYVEQWLGRTMAPLAPPDGVWQDGDDVWLGEDGFKVWHTPGHSPGSVCLIGETVAFTGDTLFASSIGRTDLPLSDSAAMQSSLRRLLQLPDELALYPGHMGLTTMGRERANNPFLRF